MKTFLLPSLLSLSLAASAGQDSSIQARIRSLGQRVQEILSADGVGAQRADLDRFFDRSRAGQAQGGEALAAPATREGQKELKARMLASLDFIRSVFKAGYAPAEWKARYAGWDLDREIEAAKKEILAAPNVGVKDFQKAARRVINSTQDYHVHIGFAATESASLPFKVLGSGGRYYIVWIDREKLPEGSFPFQVGDELAQLGGRSTAEVARELQASLGKNTEETDRAIAALSLTSRRASRGLEVPREPVTISVRSRATGKLVTHQLAWDYTPESVEFSPLKAQEADGRKFRPRADDMLSPLYLKGLQAGAENPFGLGTRKSYIPALGEKLWESAPEDPFYAYLYRAPKDGKVIGYVRIPSYVPRDVPKAVKHFGELMAKFEKTTDALVIDQINNPGGGVFYLYTLASMLTDQSLKAPRHRIALTQKDVTNAAEFLELEKEVRNDEDSRKVLGPDLNGYPVTYQLFKLMAQFSRFTVKEWNAGRTLTSPTWLYGVDNINPSTVATYTKPILVLINELDFSGGDFFPAILQDNRRAKFLGTRTAGAGGFVNGIEFPNWLGIDGISLTGSIAERADGNPIENLGVKPDIEYALTAEDLQGGYRGYVSAIHKAVGELVCDNWRCTIEED